MSKLGGHLALTLGLLASGHLSSQTGEVPPAPVLAPSEALERFSIAPGFSLHLVAAEPLIEDPVAIAWDETGNLYAAEMRGFMPDTYGTNQSAPVGAVVRLKDTDEDGVYDQREVLAGELVLPRAVAIVNEGLLFAEPPSLWLCPNSDGRGETISCADKVRLGAYGDQPGSVEHAENGLLMGLDNWLYSAKSSRRLRIVKGELVSEPTIFRGQWGIDKDNAGRLYYNSNSVLLLGDSYDGQAAARAGITQAPGLGARISQDDQMFAVRANPGVNRAYVAGVLRGDGRLNRPTSASGMAVYRGGQFGPEYADDVFVAEPAANVVAHLRLKRDGLTVTAEHMLYADEVWGQREFLASTDERFRPVDVKAGPDGALYVVDMYRGVIQDHVFISEQLRAHAQARGLDRPLGLGRIWRIVREGGKRVSVAPKQDTLTRLGHAVGWQRDTAQRLLIADPSGQVRVALRGLAQEADSLTAVHALWTLDGRGELEAETVMQAIGRGHEAVQLAALEAGGHLLAEGALLDLGEVLTAPRLRQQLIFSLAAHAGSVPVQAFLSRVLMAVGDDTFVLSAVQAAVFGQELGLFRLLLEDRAWLREGAAAGILIALVRQGLRADPDKAGQWLDLAERSRQASIARSVLEGFSAFTRDEAFERIRLDKPHPVLSAQNEQLWPSIVRARRAVTWPGDDLPAGAKPLSSVQSAQRALGADYYARRCASCHGLNGEGVAGLGPVLAGSLWVTGASEVLARIVLQGLQGPIEVDGEIWNAVMPGHAAMPDFDDATAAGLLTYLNRAWGHAGRAVDTDFIVEVRRQTEGRTGPWTVEALAEIDVNTHYVKYQGRYGGGDFVLEFAYSGKALEVRSGIFNGPLREQREDHFIFEPRRIELEFMVADDGESVYGVRMATPEGGMLIPRTGDL